MLLIDCDPSGCATEWVGINDSQYRYDISCVLNRETGFADAIVKTKLTWLDILPAGFDLFKTALQLSTSVPNQTLLRTLLQEDFACAYEYIIIDAPSSYGFLSVMALTAADWLILPICPGITSKNDCHCLLRLITHIRKTHNIPLKIGGFVFNHCNTKGDIQIFAKQQLSVIADLVYGTHIPADMNVATSIGQKTPLVLYDIKSPASLAFLGFAKEIDAIFT